MDASIGQSNRTIASPTAADLSHLTVPLGDELSLRQLELSAGRRNYSQFEQLAHAAQAAIDALDRDCSFKKFCRRLETPDVFWRTGNLVTLPSSGSLIVCGDLHGDFDALRMVLRDTRCLERIASGEDIRLLLVGDVINRGQSIPTLELALSLVSHPLLSGRVIYLRGNHEDTILSNQRRSMWNELENHFPFGNAIKKRPEKAVEILQNLFDRLPLAARTPNGLLITHGGLTKDLPWKATVQEKLFELAKGGRSVAAGLLDGELRAEPGVRASARRDGRIEFCVDSIANFLYHLGASYLIRGHQPAAPKGVAYSGRPDDGGYYSVPKMLTLNTTRTTGRMASYAVVDLSRPAVDADCIEIRTLNLPYMAPVLPGQYASSLAPGASEIRKTVNGE